MSKLRELVLQELKDLGLDYPGVFEEYEAFAKSEREKIIARFGSATAVSYDTVADFAAHKTGQKAAD